MPEKEVSERKQEYRRKLEKLLADYKSIIVIGADNVGSNQMQKIRIALRGHGILLMGKNTIMRKVIRELLPSNPKLEKIMPCIYGNIGFVFTNGDLKQVRDIILSNKVPAAAKSGTMAPSDVWVPAGPTGLDPGQTSFFQALNIATKIVKGTIEIANDVHLIKLGQKVNPSHVSLLAKLNIKPFFYGMAVTHIYEDGTVYGADVLDLSQDVLVQKFLGSVQTLAALSLRIGVPNLATLPHSIARALKNLFAIAVTTDVTFKEAEPFKEYLADPAAYAAKHGLGAGAASGSAPAAAAAGGKKEAPKKAEPEPVVEEEPDMGLGGGLFD